MDKHIRCVADELDLPGSSAGAGAADGGGSSSDGEDEASAAAAAAGAPGAPIADADLAALRLDVPIAVCEDSGAPVQEPRRRGPRLRRGSSSERSPARGGGGVPRAVVAHEGWLRMLRASAPRRLGARRVYAVAYADAQQLRFYTGVVRRARLGSLLRTRARRGRHAWLGPPAMVRAQRASAFGNVYFGELAVLALGDVLAVRTPARGNGAQLYRGGIV